MSIDQNSCSQNDSQKIEISTDYEKLCKKRIPSFIIFLTKKKRQEMVNVSEKLSKRFEDLNFSFVERGKNLQNVNGTVCF